MGGFAVARRPKTAAAIKACLLGFVLMGATGLSACTTTEGTNALTDVGTFEREVMDTTLVGVGLLNKPAPKADPTNNRGPLVLPKAGVVMPPPGEDETKTATLLPADSDKPQVNTQGLSDDDLKRLRNARVVTPTTPGGRPLTQAEIKQMMGKMQGAQISSGPRPLYMPPVSYYTTVNGQDTVCLAANGELVPINDKACPSSVRSALAQQATVTPPPAPAK